MEMVTGCETENKYLVMAADKDGNAKKKNVLFKCKEKSSFCARQCLNGDCRPFKIKVEHDSKGESLNEGEMAFKFNREFACTLLCCNRPELSVEHCENG